MHRAPCRAPVGKNARQRPAMNNVLAPHHFPRRMCIAFRMGGRVVECARLESVLGLTVYEGSNPSPSATSGVQRNPKVRGFPVAVSLRGFFRASVAAWSPRMDNPRAAQWPRRQDSAKLEPDDAVRMMRRSEVFKRFLSLLERTHSLLFTGSFTGTSAGSVQQHGAARKK